MLIDLMELLVKIILIMGAGYFFAKKKIITPQVKQSLSTVLVHIVLYFSILSSSQQALNTEYLKGILMVFLASSVYYAVSIPVMLGLGKAMGLSRCKKEIFTTMAVFANVGFIGFSMISEIVGEEGVLYAVAYNAAYNIFFFSWGLSLLAKGTGKTQKVSPKDILTNKMLLVSVLAIVFYMLPVRFPAFLSTTLSSVGGMMMPISMLVIGAEIAEMKVGDILRDKYSFAVSFLRLIAIPILMIPVVKLLGFSANTAMTFVVLSALPAGSLNVIMAQEYRCEPEFAARAVAQSMLLMLVTLPVVIMLVKVI